MSGMGNEHDLAPIHLPLYEDEARHLLDGLSHPTNAMTINGYSCPICKRLANRLRPRLRPLLPAQLQDQQDNREDVCP